MARSRFWGMCAAVTIGALAGVLPAGMAATEAEASAPGVNVCVFYGICVGPALPGR